MTALSRARTAGVLVRFNAIWPDNPDLFSWWLRGHFRERGVTEALRAGIRVDATT